MRPVAVASGNNAFKGQVSAGIVTGLSYTFNDRILSDAETPKDLMHMINTSTVMTGSNNGGALVNKKGQVVALTVFIKDEQQNGFFKAIPINKVKKPENLEVSRIMKLHPIQNRYICGSMDFQLPKKIRKQYM